MKKTGIVPRILALFLSSSLALPSPALALRPTTATQSGVEEKLTSRLRESVPPSISPAAGAEEWGEATWNRLYEFNAAKGTPLWEALEGVLEAYVFSASAAHIEQLWDMLRSTIPQKDSPLIEAVQAFQQRRIIPVFMPRASLLYDRDRKEGVLLVGDERRFQLIVALLEENSKRWELLAHDQPIGFESNGQLIAGWDPLVEAGERGIPFDPPTKKGQRMKVQIIRRFVPIQRVVWLTPRSLADISERAFQGAIFRESFFSNIPEPFLKTLTSLPRTVVPVPTHAPVRWYRNQIVPAFPAAGAEEAVNAWLQASRPSFSEPLKEFQVRELLKPLEKPGTAWVEGTVGGVPAMIGLQKIPWPKALQMSPMPKTFRLYVQMGAMSKEQIIALIEWLGVPVEVLPDELAEDRRQEIIREIRRPREGQPRQPESLLVLNRKTFEQFDLALADFNPFEIPAVIVGVRERALDRAEFPAILSYLLDLLDQAGTLGHLVMDRLEDSFSVESERGVTYLLRST